MDNAEDAGVSEDTVISALWQLMAARNVATKVRR